MPQVCTGLPAKSKTGGKVLDIESAHEAANDVGASEARTSVAKRSPKQTAVKAPKVVAAEPIATTADDIATISKILDVCNAIRDVCFDSVVGKTPSPIARAFFEVVSKVSEQALWGIDCEKGATAAERAYAPHVLRMLQDMRDQAFELSTSIESKKKTARIIRARELLGEAKRDRDAGKPIDVIVAELIAHEMAEPPKPNRIEASVEAWTNAVTRWQGITERVTQPPENDWSVIVFKLVYPGVPGATRDSIRKSAETMRENFKSSQAKKKSPSRK
jgi:hypothetical protein